MTATKMANLHLTMEEFLAPFPNVLGDRLLCMEPVLLAALDFDTSGPAVFDCLFGLLLGQTGDADVLWTEGVQCLNLLASSDLFLTMPHSDLAQAVLMVVSNGPAPEDHSLKLRASMVEDELERIRGHTLADATLQAREVDRRLILARKKHASLQCGSD